MYMNRTNFSFLFQLNEWLSTRRNNKRVEAFIHESSSESAPKSSRSISKMLVENHLVGSLFMMTGASPFTYIQRFSICVCVISQLMVSNAMWYNTSVSSENNTVFKVGPFTLTLQEIYVSFMTALIVSPCSHGITFLFKLSRQLSNTTDLNELKCLKCLTPLQKSKLSRCCLVLAWVTVLLSTITSWAFTLFYSIEWGAAKSNAWLGAFILSFLENVTLFDPLMVC